MTNSDTTIRDQRQTQELPVQLIRGGSGFFSILLQLIRESRISIHLQTYILNDDETGLLVIDALEAASARGVDIFVLADGYASQVLSQKTIDSMRVAGIRFRYFEPIFRSRLFYFGRRLHHKLFVADEAKALVGGINITNRYNDMPDQPAWLDYALLISGHPALQIATICRQTWNGEYKPRSNKQDENEKFPISVRRNDWVRHYNEISGTYIDMLRHARSQVTIVSSYFLPGKIIRRLLRHAAARGVLIRVITAGPSDVMISKHAERWMYDWMLRNGIQLFEYQPVILHAKAAVCDNQWLTLGSYNVNNISAYASIELNVDIKDPAIAITMEEQLDKIIQHDCIAITSENHRKAKNPFIQFIRWSSYQFIRVVFTLLTFYFRRKS